MQNQVTLRVANWVNVAVQDRTSSAIWVHGGLGCGKTFGACCKHYQWILENLDCPVSWWIEPTFGKIDSIAIPAWRDLFKIMNAREGKHYQFYNSKPQRLEVYTGLSTHIVRFQSADRAQLMVGDNIGYFTLDEAGEVKFDAYERSTHRLRDKKANYTQKVICGAPQGLNWFADFADFNCYDSKKNERSFEVWTEHNAHNLAPNYIAEQLKIFGHNKAKVDSWLFGRFTNFFEGQAYPDFDPALDIDEIPPHASTPLVLSWDNNAPLAWVALQERYFTTGLDREKRLCIVKESAGNARLIADACVDFIAKFDPDRGWRDAPIILDGDAALFSPSVRQSGSSFDEIIKILKQYYTNVQIIASRANPLQEVRVEAVNRAFSYRKVMIDRDCKKTVKSFQQTSWKEGNQRELSKPRNEDVNAFSDAAGYHIKRWIERLDIKYLP